MEPFLTFKANVDGFGFQCCVFEEGTPLVSKTNCENMASFTRLYDLMEPDCVLGNLNQRAV